MGKYHALYTGIVIMEAEFFIHGPRHAFYGKQEGNQYCQLFDNSQIKDEIRFIVEVRKAENGKFNTYYNYCRYANVLDVDGRNGAYIGLTVRLDAYYANLRIMYTVLDAIFKSSVVGLLVKKIPSGFQYVVADFNKSRQSILTNVEKKLGTILVGVISEAEVYTIDSSFSMRGKEIIKGLDDNRYTLLRLADVKKAGKIVFASSQPLDCVEAVSQESERNIEILKEERDKEIAQIRSSFDESQAREIALKENISKGAAQIIHLEEEKKTLQNKLLVREEKIEKLNERLKSFASIGERLDKLQEEIGSLRKEKQSLENELEKCGNVVNQSNGGDDSDCTAREKRGYIDKVSLKWNFGELREGLKKGIFAFFLLAVIVGSGLFIINRSRKQKPLVNKCLRIPNELTKRLYPDVKSGNTIEKLVVKRDELDSNKINLVLEMPAIHIDEYEWLVTGLNSDTIFYNRTSSNSVSFRLNEDKECKVSIFVKDTLIVKRRNLKS